MESRGTVISPWFTVKDVEKAVIFYKSAFEALEAYHLEDPGGGVVVRLAVQGAEFWIASGDESNGEQPLGGTNVRMILVVDDPDSVFRQALDAGAQEIYPVHSEHGWKVGRLCDPFGMHWEISKEL